MQGNTGELTVGRCSDVAMLPIAPSPMAILAILTGLIGVEKYAFTIYGYVLGSTLIFFNFASTRGGTCDVYSGVAFSSEI